MEKRIRLFFAVNLPDAVKREIAERILQQVPKEKWRIVKPENLHITLRFLGYFPNSAIQDLKEKADTLQEFGAFELELKGIGHFRNRVLWAGIGRGTDEVCTLARKLNDALGTSDERFHAHVTLARNRGMKNGETDELIDALRKKGFEATLQIDSFELMKSKLAKSGPEYRRAFSVQLFKDPA